MKVNFMRKGRKKERERDSWQWCGLSENQISKVLKGKFIVWSESVTVNIHFWTI